MRNTRRRVTGIKSKPPTLMPIKNESLDQLRVES